MSRGVLRHQRRLIYDLPWVDLSNLLAMGFERATLTDKVQLGDLGFETATQTQLGFDLA